MEEIFGSQESTCPDIPLSQDTMNTLINACGGYNSVNGLIGDNFEQIQTDDELADCVVGQDETEVHVSRTVIHASLPSSMPQWSGSQALSQGFPPPATHSSHITDMPALITRQPPAAYQNGLVEPESPLLSTPHLTPPPSTSYSHPPHTPLTPLHSVAGPSGVSNPVAISTKPFPGDYGFELVFEPDSGKKISKSANFTYSRLTSKAYIKRQCPITFTFSFQRPPLNQCSIRATPIYNAPELAGELVACCLTCVHEQTEAGKLFPSHFVRPQENLQAMTSFYGDGISRPSSIVTPFTTLTQQSCTTWTMVYQFPCVNSHRRHKKQVELMFTLELDGEVLGRCLVPVRVCSSPGRDRINEETKKKKEEEDKETKASRKRGNPTEMIQCTLPPKRPCVALSLPKVTHKITTHKELIPYIDVCVRMMEQVHSVPVPLSSPQSEQLSSPREMFPSVDAWLEHIELGRYVNMFRSNGVTRLYQVPGITDQELKSWGVRTVAHRKKILAEKDKVIQHTKDEDREPSSTPSSVDQDGPTAHSPPLFQSQSSPTTARPPYMTRQLTKQLSSGSHQALSQSSQLSSGSSHTMVPAFEVVQIKMKKKISGSSSGSSQQ